MHHISINRKKKVLVTVIIFMKCHLLIFKILSVGNAWYHKVVLLLLLWVFCSYFLFLAYFQIYVGLGEGVLLHDFKLNWNIALKWTHLFCFSTYFSRHADCNTLYVYNNFCKQWGYLFFIISKESTLFRLSCILHSKVISPNNISFLVECFFQFFSH